MSAITLAHASAIRPLGEEHLRMFRRSIGSTQGVPKVALPMASITLSDEETNSKEISKHIAPNHRMATFEEVVMDLKFVEEIRDTWVFVSSSGFTPKKGGRYKIDRLARCLIEITEEQAKSLEWHENLYVYQSALEAVDEGRPLVAVLGYGDWNGYRVIVESEVYVYLARVAQVKEGD